MKKIIKHRRKGFVLVSALLVTSISLLLLIPYASGVFADLKLTTVVNNSTMALNLAEAGAERAIWEISYNSAAANFTVPVTSLQSSAGDNIGEYDAAVILDSNSAVITSYGYVPNKSSYTAKKTVVITYSFHRAFGKGVAGLTGITMSGQADIDSYDSSLGAYNALLSDGTYNKGQEGDIASNGPIIISGQAKVWGDANPGPDDPFEGTPNDTGTYDTLQAPLTVDPIPDTVMAAAQAVNDNSNIHTHVIVNGVDTVVPYSLTNDALSVSNGTVNLAGGTYYFTSININAQLIVEAPSTIYVVGDVAIAGTGIINTGALPKDFILYSTGADIKIAGQGAFYGAIYAPEATVVYTGLADFYGSIVCGFNADKGQAALHYDKDLIKVMPGFVFNKVTSWQEK